MKLAHKIGWLNTLILTALSFTAVFFLYAQFQRVMYESIEREMLQTAEHYFAASAQSRGIGRSVNNPLRQELIRYLYIAVTDCPVRGFEVLQDPFGIGRQANVGLLEVEEGLKYYGVEYTTDGQTFLLVQEATAAIHTLHAMRNWLFVLAGCLVGLSFFLGRFAASWSLKPLLMVTGQIRGINAQQLEKRFETNETTQEIVELKDALNKMLEKIQRGLELQKRFSSDVAHELRTPITSIKGYAQLLQNWGLRDQEAARESVDAIRETADEMGHLIQQLLSLSLMEEEDNLPLEPFASKPWIEELKSSIHRRYPDRAFFWENQEFPDPVASHSSGLRQLIMIFVDNSVAFSDDHTPVEICFGQDQIQIQDNGPGIDPREIPNLFERFYRTDRSRRSDRSVGHGIGMAIAREIARKIQAEIQVKSELGLGTTITILLRSH